MSRFRPRVFILCVVLLVLGYFGIWRSDKQGLSSGPVAVEKASATFLMVTRNRELNSVLKTVRSVEDRFNREYGYDWVFASHEPFHDNFKAAVANLCSGNVKFEQIPASDWGYPEHTDQELAKSVREKNKKRQNPHGDSERFRLKNRYLAHGFAKLKALDKYKYYCHVEPYTEFKCDITFDVFMELEKSGKKYGFANAPIEPKFTVEGLWKAAKDFMSQNAAIIHENNAKRFLTDVGGVRYSQCTFSTNFEVGLVSFFRSPEYSKVFEHFDQQNGFFYERWTASNIHTIAVSLLLDRGDILHYDPTGYADIDGYTSCPKSDSIHADARCFCDPLLQNTWNRFSCLPRWYDVAGLVSENYDMNQLKNLNARYKNPKKRSTRDKKYQAALTEIFGDDDSYDGTFDYEEPEQK